MRGGTDIFEQARPVSECATRMFCVGCIALASGGESSRHVGGCEGPRAALSVHGCFVESRSELSGRGPIWAIPGRRWDPKSPRRGTTGWLSAAGRLRWRGHFRESEGLSTAQIAERLGRAPATVKACFYDPSKVVKKLYGLNLRSKAWNRFFTCLVHDQMRCCRETR